MQVTPEMVAAAQAATPRWMNATDSEIRYIIEAALEVAGDVELPVVANVRVQIDEPAFHASVAEAVQRMNDGLPRDRNGLITIATLLGKPNEHRIPVTEPRALVAESQLHLHLGVSKDFIGNAIDRDKHAMTTFPWPVRQDPGQERLYDPDAVKALPQAANG